MLAAISVGVWAMIFMSALMRGMVDDMLSRGIDQLPGHVQIHNDLYMDDPSVVNSFPEPSGSLLESLSRPEVAKWFGRVKVPAVISSEQDSRGIILLGIDPALEQETILSGASISEGRFLESPSEKGVVIGQKLAERLETRLGKKIVITSQDPDNELAEMGARILGIYQAELPSEEEMYLYMGKETLQELLNIPGQVSEIAVFGHEYREVSAVDKLVADGIKRSGGELKNNISHKKWSEVNNYLGSIVRFMDGFVLVWIVVIFIALSFGLANTLVMAVFERIREIGLMLALGMRPVSVTWQILIESVFLLILGLVIGNLLAIVTISAISDGIDLSSVAKGFEMAGMGTTLYPLLLVKDMISANIIVILLGIATSYIPARHAAHYDPIRALARAT